MKQYKIAVFDLDGTILDTAEGLLAAVKYTIDKMGLTMLSDEQLLTFIGPPIQDSFAKAYHLEGDILQTIATCFRNRYKDYDLLKAVPYAGIYEVFENLYQRGIRIAVATYKRQDYAELILKHFGFDKYTKIMYGADHENKLKKVDIIEKCLLDCRIYDGLNAVMVGDSSYDAVGAQKMGIDFIGVTYGFRFRTANEVLQAGAVGYANTPGALINYF